VTLTGWQAIAALALGVVLALATLIAPAPLVPGLLGLAGVIIGGVMGMFSARSPQSRTRAGDRRDTAAGGVPVTPPPETLPPPGLGGRRR
jgi:hypothetical protein